MILNLLVDNAGWVHGKALLDLIGVFALLLHFTTTSIFFFVGVGGMSSPRTLHRELADGPEMGGRGPQETAACENEPRPTLKGGDRGELYI